MILAQAFGETIRSSRQAVSGQCNLPYRTLSPASPSDRLALPLPVSRRISVGIQIVAKAIIA